MRSLKIPTVLLGTVLAACAPQAPVTTAPAAPAAARVLHSPGDDQMALHQAHELVWNDLGLIPRVQIAVLQGNPGAEGYYTLRLRVPDGVLLPPHWHPRVEYATVVSGTITLGMGETADRANTIEVGPGGFAVAPARMPHYLWARGETVIQLSGPGPYEVVFVNPADDPRLR